MEKSKILSYTPTKIKDFELHPDEDRSLTELLAFISMFNEGVEKEVIYKFNDDIINANYDMQGFINKLISYRLIRLNNGNLYKATFLGQSVAKSFLTIEISLSIIEELKKKEKKIIEIVLELKSLRNVYLTKKVVADLSKHRPAKYSSNNFFSSSVLSLMDANYVKKRKTFSDEFIEYVVKWTKEIFNCDCKDNPYCECGRLNLEKIILNLRIEDNFSIKEVAEYLENELEIMIYKGDITDYLENLIYSFESVLNISRGVPNLDPIYNEEISNIPNIIKRIRK
ncbi:MAG: DUF5814 domain-containing protein [Promethearchaeota archaeon]